MADKPKTGAKMASEFVREAAVLLLVFVPIDAILAKREFDLSWVAVTVIGIVSTVVSLGLFFLGVLLEQSRGEE